MYLSSVFFVWLAQAIYHFTPYYKSFLTHDTKTALLSLSFAYTLIAPVVYIIAPKNKLAVSTSYVAFSCLKRISGEYVTYLRDFTLNPRLALPKISERERVATLFLLVKFFFLPLMLNVLFGNFHAMQSAAQGIDASTSQLSIMYFNSVIFPIVLYLLYTVDVAIGVFGYATESNLLHNRVKSVEPTMLGWIVALISYAPFVGLLGTFAPAHFNDNNAFVNMYAAFAIHILVLAMLSIFVSATVALGPKASNLTNRGIVSRGPYKYVRHPAYITKNLGWWITIIPVFSLAAVASMVAWSFVYFLRAITEERHLIRDPDYQAYCKKVKYRFIPRVI
jgi:protein-S-isoprenylcysteine O-methyltransferase Ste14